MPELSHLAHSEKLEDMTELLKAIAHPVRLAIIELLQQHQQLSVSQIQKELALEQAVASHHLIILKNKDVLDARRTGKSILYYLANEGYGHIVELARSLV